MEALFSSLLGNVDWYEIWLATLDTLLMLLRCGRSSAAALASIFSTSSAMGVCGGPLAFLFAFSVMRGALL